MYGVLGDEDKRRAAWLLPACCGARADPSLRSPGRCTTKLATRCVTRPATAAPGAARLTRKRGQGDLSGEQFDKLYRFYREVYAKVCFAPGRGCRPSVHLS